MSSRQQVLFLLQKTQKEANWDMENDSDFQDDYSLETYQNHNDNDHQLQIKRNVDSYSNPFNEEFEIKREKMRQQEIKNHPERFRLLAHSLSQFTPIKKNKYLERKRHVLLEKEANSLLVCNCQRATLKKNEKTNPLQSFNCGERCINRCVSTECCAQTCPSGVFCKNRRFQLHQNAYVFPAKTEKKGWGLFAGEYISKGTFIMQYVGEIFSVDSDLGQERVQEYKNSTCTYLMRTTNNEVIDPTYVGNIARFINHSCEPSCETQKWNVLGEVCVGIFALRDIHENEELSFDYQFDFFKTPFTKCYCGTSKCKGYLGVLSRNNDDDDDLENPTCSQCEDFINDKDELLVCNGSCRETFHIACIIKKEGKTKTQALAFMQQSDRRNFICRDCLVKFNGRKKRGRKSQRELEDILRLKEQEQLRQENVLDNPQEDKDDGILEIDLPPWESKVPEVRKFFEDNIDNRELDKIITRELDQIQLNIAELNDQNNNSSKVKRAKKKNSQFSDHYNFMSELLKRLKMRLYGDKKHYKFRKHKDDIQEMKRNRLQLIQTKRLQRQVKVKVEEVKKKRGRPRKIQSSLSFNVQKTNQLQLKPIMSTKVNTYKEEEKLKREKLVEIDEEMISQLSQKSSESHSDEESSEKLSKFPEDINLNENLEESFLSSNHESEEEEDEDDDEEEDREEEDDEEEYDDEDDNEDQESLNEINDELNLEKLQGQIEDQEEEKQMKSLEEQKSITNNQLNERSQNNESLFRKRLRQYSDEQELSNFNENQMIKRTPLKNNQIVNASPSKNSTLQNIPLFHNETLNRDRVQILNYIKSEMDEFLQEQIKASSSLTPSELLVRESKFNIYEIVFNMIVPENIDTFQCFPTKFQIFWEQAWGGMVTVRLQSTLKQYLFVTGLMQDVTDQLFKSNLLCTNSQGGLLTGNRLDIASHKDNKQYYPFDIIMLKVPKNFIRKLVGYQEKTLTEYRKTFSVDFYFDRDLLTDDVFHMNETTELRVFGKNQDVYAVNELIQKELDQIKMKTILLQMNDCKLLMDNVKEVKVFVDPCEIRVKRMMREWKDLRHPFYYLPNYFREMTLIGKDQEIKDAESRIEQFFLSKRDMNYVNNQQISFLLPIYFKSISNDIKTQLNMRCPQIQIFFYEPTYPRKHLTVLMIGPWITLMQAKIILEEQANVYMLRNNHSFENFQQFTYHQQIRFSFKSLKRFVLEKDIKYLNHWDLCSIFVEDAGKQYDEQDWTEFLNSTQPPKLNFNPLLMDVQQLNIMQRSQSQTMLQNQIELKTQEIEKERKKDFKALIEFLKNQDVETCINSLFVLYDSNKAEESLGQLMERLQVNKNELIHYMSTMLSKNIQDYDDSLKSFNGRYESIKIIDQQDNDQEKLVIQQNKDVSRRPRGYYATASYYNRSKSPSYHQHNNSHSSHYHQGSYRRENEGSRNMEHQMIKPFDHNVSREEFKDYRNSHQSQSKSRSISKTRRQSSYSSRKSSSDRGSQRHQKYKRNNDSPDFTRPHQDYRSSNQLREYGHQRSPTREYRSLNSYSYSNHAHSHRDETSKYQHHDQRSRSKYHHPYSSHSHHNHHGYRRRSQSDDSSHKHHHRPQHKHYSHHYHQTSRYVGSYRHRSRSPRSESSERYYKKSHSHEKHRRNSRSQFSKRSRSRYANHPYFMNRDPYYSVRAIQNSNRPKYRGGFDYGTGNQVSQTSNVREQQIYQQEMQQQQNKQQIREGNHYNEEGQI